MREKEIYTLNGHTMLTLEMDEKEFMEFRDTMQTIENLEYEIMDMRPRLPVLTDMMVEGWTSTSTYWLRDRGCAYTVRINDRIDESIEAYTAGSYLAGNMSDADARRLLNWRENAESIRIERTSIDM